MGSELLISLIISLLLTIVTEGLFAIIYGVRSKSDLALLCLVNILTNPAVVFIYHMARYYTGFNPVTIVLGLELTAIAVEGFYYKGYGKTIKKPFLFAVYANSFSFCIGKLISTLI